jgi:hypothetical protein
MLDRPTVASAGAWNPLCDIFFDVPRLAWLSLTG